jgi:mxaK protein
MARRLKLFQLMLLVLCLSFALSIWLIVSLYQASIYNGKLSAKTLHTGHSADEIFANAVYWKSNGEMQKALSLYAEAASGNQPVIRKSAYFNSGNLYLSQANQLLEEKGLDAFDQVGPMLAMAKESYREALRSDPAWHEAKYNYELALRLAPMFELKKSNRSEDEDEPEEEEATDGWPSIPGFPRGMP